MLKTMLKTFLLLVLFSSATLADGFSEFPRVALQIKGQSLLVEYADTDALRDQGLMYRKQLCADCGMLFKLDLPHRVEMWMKNTYIPLDVAFVRTDGLIVGIEAMQPLDLTLIEAPQKVLYIWEMNQGWFLANNIVVGDRLSIN